MPSLSNFPQGFANGVTLRNIPILQMQPGNVFFVDNSLQLGGDPVRTVGGSDQTSARGTFQRPFASIAGALAQCVQGNGDIIFLKPGHIETVNGAGTTTQPNGALGTALAFNVAGVAIIGLGGGLLRPIINFTTAATANIPVRATCMSIQNVLFTANFADIASVFTAQSASVTASIATTVMTVTAVGSGTLYPGAAIMGTGIVPGSYIINQLTGTTGGIGTYTVSVPQTFASGTITTGTHDFAIDKCEFRDSSSVLNFISIFTASGTANGSDGFSFTGNKIKSLGTTAATTALKTTVNQDRWIVDDNNGVWAVLNNTAALLAAGAASITAFECARNNVIRPNTSTTSGLAISTSGTAWTGQCFDNRFGGLNNTAQIWINTGTGLFFNQNFCMITAAADKSGLINPAAV